MISSRIMGNMVIICVLVGLLAWSGAAHAVKPNPPGKQGGKFVVLGTGDVLDVRTSLRWQQAPGAPGDTVSNCDSSPALSRPCTWQEGMDYCAAPGHGSRLPEIQELASLVDYSASPCGPGYPFNYVVSYYWSAMSPVNSPVLGRTVYFVTGWVVWSEKSDIGLVWCVR